MKVVLQSISGGPLELELEVIGEKCYVTLEDHDVIVSYSELKRAVLAIEPENE